ncbi:MAG: hypothetical protein Q9226_006451, partial [Calogaya cf. arnoldii]
DVLHNPFPSHGRAYHPADNRAIEMHTSPADTIKSIHGIIIITHDHTSPIDLDQYRDYASRHQSKLPMPQDPQQRANRARMTRQRNESTFIMFENFLIGLTFFIRPELIVLRHRGFEDEVREGLHEGGFGAAAIAGVDAVGFAEELHVEL